MTDRLRELGLHATGARPRDARLLRRTDFQRVQSRGVRAHGGVFTVFALGGGDRARLGTSLSRKVGKAVVRNRIRRLIRETFRRLDLPPVDFVVVARPGAGAVASDLASAAAVLVPALRRVGERAHRESARR